MTSKPSPVPATVTVDRFRQTCGPVLSLVLVAGGEGLSREVKEPKVQKVGLGITGEVDSTHDGRIQVFGETEIAWLSARTHERRAASAKELFSRDIPCLIVAGGFQPPAEFVAESNALAIPLFSSPRQTSDVFDEALRGLSRIFAEKSTIHGVLVDVLGVGVLLLGSSGVGKSECALELIVRGHRFVADDVVWLEKRSPETVLGSGSGLTRHHMEVRGLGIINIRDLFGLSSINDMKKVELVIQFEAWAPEKEYDRLGLDDRKASILGVMVPQLLVPVSPGRDLATIVEVAVRNHLLKGQGVHSAREMVERLARKTSEGEG